MRLLGTKASLPVVRWDLVFLMANLQGDDRPGVADLAPPIAALFAELREERDRFEQAEDAAVVVLARKSKRDRKLDGALVRLGGVARATDKDLYGALFPKLNPTRTTRLGLASEVRETARILGELARLPGDHPLRVEYEGEIQGALEALRQTMGEADQAATALALARTRLERFKLRVDEARIEAHGKLLALLKDKAEADAFFRSTTATPDPAGDDGDEAPAPDAPLPG